MMAITVNLWSKKAGEIKKFLECYYCKDIQMDEDVDNWIYVYKKPLEAVDIISAVMDNSNSYKIMVCLQINDGDLHPVTSQNHNDVIRGIFDLFYVEQ